MKATRMLALLLAFLTAAGALAACAKDTGETPKNSGQNDSDSLPEETEEAYSYPEDADYGDYVFRVLNVDKNLWGAYTSFDAEDSGEGLDSAIYRRNRLVEELLHVTFQEINVPSDNLADQLIQSVSADSDEYDIAFAMNTSISRLIPNGYILNLLDEPDYQFDKPWWDKDVVNGLSLNDKLYAVTGPINLMASDLTACLWMNRDMIRAFNLEMPYDTVRDGKWTLDAFYSLNKAVANLNGQESFSPTPDGSATYGLMTSWVFVPCFMYGFDMNYFEQDGDGDFVFAADSERFMTRLQKLSDFLSRNDGAARYDTDISSALTQAHKDGRVLFFTNELKACIAYRDSDMELGVMPFPKYDETQENYRSTISLASMYTVPATNRDPERTAVISDMLAYYSYKNVMSEYYTNYLFVKGLRDKDDDVEMMQLITQVRGVDPAVVLGWIGGIHGWDALPKKVGYGDTDLASYISTQRDQMINAMEDMMFYAD